jgi:hypothetical protein
MIRDVLNKILWDKNECSHDYVVTFIHRGAINDRKTIPFNSIVNVFSSYFVYRREKEEVYIPFHRILEIKNEITGEVMWRK